jgi:hypothetical protein
MKNLSLLAIIFLACTTEQDLGNRPSVVAPDEDSGSVNVADDASPGQGVDAGRVTNDAGRTVDSGNPPPVDAATPTPDAGAGAGVPQFVAAGSAAFSTNGVIDLTVPGGTQSDDLMLALVNAQETGGPNSLVTPAGWTPLVGFPIHNVVTSYAPYIIPTIENHGTWIFRRTASATEPSSLPIQLASATPVRGLVVVYRGADVAAPIHDKNGAGYFGQGDSNGLGMGNTTLTKGTEVSFVTTAFTVGASYSVVAVGGPARRSERVNTGEQPNGLNLIVHDSELSSFGIFTGHKITNRVSPSGSVGQYLFSATTLVLKPR